MLGSKYRNEGKDAEKRDNERWDGGKRGGRRRGSDSESSRGEGSDSSDAEARFRSNRRGSERDERDKDRERRRGSERRGREIEKPRKRLEEEEDGRRRGKERNGRRDSDSESAGEERDRYRSVRLEEDQPKKKLDEEEDGDVGNRKRGDNRQKDGRWENESDTSEEERDKKRSDRREQDQSRKSLDEEDGSKLGNRKGRDSRQRNGRGGNDSESSGEDRERSERREQDHPRKKLNEEEDRKVVNKKGREGRQRIGRRENDSASSDEEKDRKKSERQEKEQPRKKLDEEEDSKAGNRKGRDSRHRNGHRENHSESSGEDKDRKRSERQEKQQPRKRSDEEEEDGKERINEGKHGKRRYQLTRKSGRQKSDSESSGREEKHRDRGRQRRKRESRRHRYDSDGSSDSDGHRKRHSRRWSENRSGKQRRDYEDGEVRSRRENNEIASDPKQESRDGKGEEAAKPQLQSQSENANPGGDLSTLGRTGGVYIPPFKLFRMMKEIEDKSSVEYQRLTWDALRKSINGLVNKVNATNIKNIIPELLGENLIRGRGLFCRSCMKSQMASPGFTDVFAALVAVVNTKFPEIGDLLLKRIILQLKRAYKRNDKPQLIAAVKFIAHLVNQQVAHELVALELLTILLEQPTDDSVEVAVDFVKECGCILQDLCPKGLHGIFERFRGILHEGEIDKRVQFLIEGLFAVRKAKFQGHPAVRPELDLVEPEDQLTHEVSLEDEIDPEIGLDIFKQDPNFMENEKKYEELKKSILGDESEDEDGSDVESDDDEDDEEEDEDDEEQQMQIKDETETNLINLRRTIYLTIMSSVDFEEAGHKLLKIKLEPGQEMELCIMLLECCSQERTYLRYYGLLGQRFCMINKVYQENFDKCFVQQYSMIHRLETNKLRNVAKFFAHLLGTDALPWHVLAYIRLTEEDTTSSSRIFIKILFQELSEHLGIRLLNERLNDPSMQDSFDSIFPKDNPRNTRFAINFFTSIGLGGITENLREYLKNMPRMIMQQQQPESEDEPDSSSSGSGSSTAESDSDSDSSSSSSSSSSEESSRDNDRRRKRKKADSGGDRHRKRRK